MFRLFIFVLLLIGSYQGYSQHDYYYQYIENKGQWPQQVLYHCELENGNLFLEKDGLKFNFWDNSQLMSNHGKSKDQQIQSPTTNGHVYQVKFLGNSFEHITVPAHPSHERFNYYRGQNKKNWASNCKAYGEVIYENVYPGIDLKMYSHDFFLKYDFVVAPNADPSNIQLAYSGQERIKIKDGRLIITLSVNQIVEQKPIAWQIIAGTKQLVECQYQLKNNVVTYEFPNGYNHNYELIIDPELIFSTYSGSTSDNFGFTATYDNDGYLYSGSSVFGLYGTYPTTAGAYQMEHAGGIGSVWFLGGTDIAITKYDTTGTFRVYSTYLGGSGDELPHSLVVNDLDELYVYGTTSSDDYPTLATSYSSDFNGGTSFNPGGVGVSYEAGSDIIVTKFNSDGSNILGSTYIGGTANDGINDADNLAFNYADEMRGEILLNNQDEVYIVSSTFSGDFPIIGGFQNTIGGAQDGCIIKMTSNLESIIWSSFLGGNSNDAAYALALDANNDIVVAGGTESTNFPVSVGSYQESFGGGNADGYLVKINAAGTAIEIGTYYGSVAYDQIYFVEIDLDDQIYVYGQTLATDSFFIDNANYNHPNSGMLVSKFDEGIASRTWSTVFGTGEGKCNLSPTAFLVDVCDRIYMAGWGGSTNVNSAGSDVATFVTNMEVSDDAYQSTTDGSDFYLLVIDSDANNMIYGSFFGGSVSSEHVDGGTSRFSPDGTIYQSVCAGCGGNSDFPIEPIDAVSPTNDSYAIANGDTLHLCNNAVFKMKFGFPTVSSVFEAPSQYCLNEAIPMVNNSESGAVYTWDFGDGSPLSNEQFPIHTFSDTGTYIIELTAYNEECDVTVNSFQTINIIAEEISTISQVNLCAGESSTLGPDSLFSNYEYTWSPSDYLSSVSEGNPTTTPLENINYTLIIHHDGCIDTLFQEVQVSNPNISLPDDYLICESQNSLIPSIFSPGSVINWYDSPSLDNSISTDDTLEIFIDQNTTIYATSTIQNCIDVDTIQVSLLAQALDLIDDFTTCANDTVQLSVLNPNEQLSYHWSPENQVLSGQNSPSITSIIEEETVYVVEANYNDLCTITDQITVTVSGINSNQISAIATPEYVLSGQEVQLQGLPSGYTYQWSPPETLDNPNIQNPIATPTENTTYSLTIYDGSCVYNTSVQVRTTDFICGNPTVYVPNAFTPNNNDQNEIIWVRGNNLTSIYFVIYDRWGKKIFETTNQSVGWDGTYEGEALDPAVFVYYLEAVCGDGQEYFEKGNITLIR